MPKGMGKRGANHGRTHLSNDDIREIRRLSALPKVERPKRLILAKRYRVAQSTIWYIVTRRTWQNVS